MFIPLTNKISWRNPPVLTILIILINAFVFFVLQGADDAHKMRAIEYYRNSGLASIELSYFSEYLNREEEIPGRPDFRKSGLIDEKIFWQYFNLMLRDDLFLQQLFSDRIIAPGNPEYQIWKDLRKEFDALEAKVVSNRFGYKPAQPSVLTALTAMFLHGGFGHLLGNMIFFWLVGCVLEYGCGRIFYLLIYFLGGLSAAALYTLFNLNSWIPCIGASGAISGLMGAYAVLFGTTRIKVFYSLGFYFNYTAFPAILLLPIWIGSELISQFFFGTVSNTAYMAHVGGLAGGGLLGWISTKLLKSEARRIFESDPKEKIPQLLEQALVNMKMLNLDEARPLFQQILVLDPGNRDVLFRLFDIDKLNSPDTLLHETASCLFLSLVADANTTRDLQHYFKEYMLLGKALKLHPDLLYKIALRFIDDQSCLKEAEQILAFLLQHEPSYQNLPLGLLYFGKALLRSGNSEKAQKCLSLLSRKFPHTNETSAALILIKRIR